MWDSSGVFILTGNRLYIHVFKFGPASVKRYIQSRFIAANTKLFKNGNSQAVRIPAELAYNSCDLELVIEREGDELRIRQAQRRMGDALDKLIASHAVALDVALVTNNEADFVNYPGLAFENWVKNH